MSNKDQLLLALQSDFKVFLRAIWKELLLPQPTKAQLAIADYLQHGPKRKQIQGFRGVGKSWITAAFALWKLWNDNEHKIMIVSASKERADNASMFMMRLISEIPWLKHLKPNDENAKWTRVAFDVKCRPAQSPSVKSVGITGQLTGSRANTIIFDDVEVPNNSLTEIMREKLLQLVSEAEAVIVPEGESEVIYLGTPQTLFTIYRKLAERGYRPFVWPARYPLPEKMPSYENYLAPELLEDLENGAKPGDPTDPQRFNSEILAEREASYGRANFALQFMLDTSLSDANRYPLKFADLIINPVSPTEAPDRIVWCSAKENVLKDLPTVGLNGDYFYRPMQIVGDWQPYQETICAVDPSGRGLDETAMHILSQRNGFIYLHESWASKDGYSDNTLAHILKRCRHYKVSTLLIESNFGDGSIAALFQKMVQELKLNITIEEKRATTRKEDRIIDSLEPVLNQHRLVVDPKVIEWDFGSNSDLPADERLGYMLCYQLSRICREKGALKRDDRLDALALGVSWFTDSLAISAQEAIIQGRRDEWADLQEAFLDDPVAAATHIALGFDLEMRKKARGIAGSRAGASPVWVKAR